jgi:hypothetical protein
MGKTMQLPEDASVQTLARFLTPHVIFRLGAGLGIILLLFQIFFIKFDFGWQESLADEVLACVSSLLAAVGLSYGAYSTDKDFPRLRRAWLLLAFAGVSWAIGDFIVLVFKIGLGRLPYPCLSDAFHLLVYPLLLAGILTLPVRRRTNAEVVEYVLDISIILLSAGLIFWNYLLGPIILSGSSSWLALLVSAAYPIADVALLWGAVILISIRYSLKPPQPVWLLSAAMVSLVILDTMLTYRNLTGIGADNEVLHLLKIISPLLLMLSGLFHVFQSSEDEPEYGSGQLTFLPDGVDLVRLALPYLWLGAAYVVLFLWTYLAPGSEFVYLSAWAAVILAMVIIRQVIVGRENHRLAAQLNHLNTDLEQLFVERTAALIRTNEELRREVFERDRMERMLRERDDKLVYFSFHDALTGLPNRALLIERLGQAIRRAKRQEDYHFTALYFDFDGFKYINDSLGHQAGDQLLIAIARRLESSIRDLDTVARLGGDEFVIVADGISADEDVNRSEAYSGDPFRTFRSARA